MRTPSSSALGTHVCAGERLPRGEAFDPCMALGQSWLGQRGGQRQAHRARCVVPGDEPVKLVAQKGKKKVAVEGKRKRKGRTVLKGLL